MTFKPSCLRCCRDNSRYVNLISGAWQYLSKGQFSIVCSIHLGGVFVVGSGLGDHPTRIFYNPGQNSLAKRILFPYFPKYCPMFTLYKIARPFPYINVAIFN